MVGSKSFEFIINSLLFNFFNFRYAFDFPNAYSGIRTPTDFVRYTNNHNNNILKN